MTKLKDILYTVALVSTSGDMEVEVKSIALDSRETEPGGMFVALKGTLTDGHQYIKSVVDKGINVVVCEVLPENIKEGVTYVAVKDASVALGVMAANFYGNPSRKLTLVGITGTNGKTTVATLLFDLFTNLGYTTGLLSTVNVRIGDEVRTATHTTPNAVAVQKAMAEMVEQSCTHVFMEVSSHAIEQNRIAGLEFDGGVFTNISHDHLDYHKTFDAYIEVKKRFFDHLPSSAFALSNIDDRRGSIMLQNTKAKVHTYSLKTGADFKAKLVSNTIQGLELNINNHEAWFRLIGEFNAYNLLAAYAVGVLCEEEEEKVLSVLSLLKGASGRFELVKPESGIVAIVDYAHTPDALKNVLETIANFRNGNEQVITVVGCGGDRDKDKRPLMASIAAKLSTKVILTSDNPRSENPLDILVDMKTGLGPMEIKKSLVISDRSEAIKTACMIAEKGDVILVAGKGHENYQEIKGVKHHFDDKEILNEMLDIIN